MAPIKTDSADNVGRVNPLDSINLKDLSDLAEMLDLGPHQQIRLDLRFVTEKTDNKANNMSLSVAALQVMLALKWFTRPATWPEIFKVIRKVKRRAYEDAHLAVLLNLVIHDHVVADYNDDAVPVFKLSAKGCEIAKKLANWTNRLSVSGRPSEYSNN